MIVIAVSKYEAPYTSLPGTLTSAARISKWASAPGNGRDYKVVEITDAGDVPVTVERLRLEIPALLESRLIDRLIVYFAGHGLVRSPADQFWLLTRAGNNVTEGVDVFSFVEGLKRYGIGANSPDLVKGQLCIIADACRNTGTAALGFRGDPILTKADKAVELQIDWFRATTLGGYAFQRKSVTDESPPYCIFSDVLCDALEGKVPSVVETKYHPFKPVILSQRLADYLDQEIPKRAAELNEDMTPDTLTGIRPDHNYYDILNTAPESTTVGFESLVLPELVSPKSAAGGRRRVARLEFEPEPVTASGFRQTLERASGLLEEAFKGAADPMVPIVVCDCSARVAVPIFGKAFVSRLRHGWVYRAQESLLSNYSLGALLDYPLFVEQEDGWIVAPLFLNTSSVLVEELPGSVLLRRVHDLFSPDIEVSWDTSLSAAALLTNEPSLRLSDAGRLANEVRIDKVFFPNNGNSAGYLYKMAGDIDNVVRTAHFMGEGRGKVPFDLAALAAARLSWVKEDRGWHVLVDLPGVEDSKAAKKNGHPYYATRAFRGIRGLEVQGLFPVHRQGWNHLLRTERFTVPDVLHSAASELLGGAAVVFNTETITRLVEHFGYTIICPDKL